MRIVLLTSDNLRHKAIANSLAKKLELQLVITERKSPAITDTSSFSKEDAEFIKQHFQQRKNTEEKFFGQFKNFPGKAKIIKVAHGQINSWPVLTEIEKTQPDYIILFGTSIIKEQLLSRYPGRIINLHLGLSPYYRGSATNLFPFYYGEPECIGGTIHLATAEVDKGEILYQFRPDMTKEDNLHDIGNKVILKGGKLLPEILERYGRGEIQPVSQSKLGRLCRNKDLTPDLLRDIYKKFKEGLIDFYLDNKDHIDTGIKIKDCTDLSSLR